MSGPKREFGEDYGNLRFLRLVEEIWPELPPDRVASGPRDDCETTENEPGEPPGAGSPLRIGRFEILRELGRGGGGIVLLAFDPRLRRHVAMKVPGPEGLLSPRLRRRFLREARAVAALRHPNIVTIHETGEAGPIPYLIMDYCEGGSLAGWLAERPADVPMSPRRSARLVARIADAVQHAHDRGILHRDLKPGNILLRDSSRPGQAGAGADEARDDVFDLDPLVSDFGLARTSEAEPGRLSETDPGVPLGTIAYMAAEAARGDVATIGPATDVYGLGVILFELLTRRRPFEGPGRFELLKQISGAEPPSPRAFRGDVPPELERICLRCLQKDPSGRYQRPAELAAELRGFDEAAAALDPERTRGVPRTPGQRRGIRAAVVAAIVASILAPAGTAFVAWSRSSARRREADELLRRLASATPGDLAALVPRISPRDPVAAPRLARLYAEGTPDQKLAAALVLAQTDPQAARYAYDRLLKAPPGAIAPIARMLQERMADLPTRLRQEIAASAGAGPAGEARDRRRAAAACALLTLGPGAGDDAWSLLRFAPDPQARSFLIHALGPAGIAPERVVERLAGEVDPSIRRALLQALGEVCEPDLPAGLCDRAVGLMLDLYENDPDPGVHGSAKWLLRRWGQDDGLRRLDERLAHAARPPERRWRVSPSGLTLVAVQDPATRRTIEIADTEVTIEFFRRFQAAPDCPPSRARGPEYPVSCVDYVLAAEFCNWLGRQESLTEQEMVYRVDRASPSRPVEYRAGRPGYRLPTTHEYELTCRARDDDDALLRFGRRTAPKLRLAWLTVRGPLASGGVLEAERSRPLRHARQRR